MKPAHWRLLLWIVLLPIVFVIAGRSHGLLGFLFTWVALSLGYNLRKDIEEAKLLS